MNDLVWLQTNISNHSNRKQLRRRMEKRKVSDKKRCRIIEVHLESGKMGDKRETKRRRILLHLESGKLGDNAP